MTMADYSIELRIDPDLSELIDLAHAAVERAEAVVVAAERSREAYSALLQALVERVQVAPSTT
jgi:uncharacterized protein (DUF1778 family)